MKKYLTGGIISLMTALPAFAQAPAAASPFRDYVNRLYVLGARIGLSLAVLITIYAGYLYMTSSGNPQQVGTAKEYLVGAVVGIGLIFLSYLILNTISPALVGR